MEFVLHIDGSGIGIRVEGAINQNAPLIGGRFVTVNASANARTLVVEEILASALFATVQRNRARQISLLTPLFRGRVSDADLSEEMGSDLFPNQPEQASQL